ncbi:MAG: DUF692 family protein [Oscillospiraceae bacterium]|nr:DUF692 family protein [Oscillospiraceae bacterium]
MKLACNYYLETEQLVRAGDIGIDYFKFPALPFQMGVMDGFGLIGFRRFVSRVSKVRPVLLHGLYPAFHDLSSPLLKEKFDPHVADRLLKITKTPGISLHQYLSKANLCVSEEQLVKTIAENVLFLKGKYPGLDFFSVENPSDPGAGALLKPEVMSEIAARADCDFLLDVSHAYCASRFMGEDFERYLSRLPLERVCEIHINGWVEKGGEVGDRMCHVKINEEGYRILRWLLARCRPDIVTIEYGRDNDRIGAGCPVMSPNKISGDAKKEIVEQVARVREIMCYSQTT